jgi:hypothetical protein
MACRSYHVYDDRADALERAKHLAAEKHGKWSKEGGNEKAAGGEKRVKKGKLKKDDLLYFAVEITASTMYVRSGGKSSECRR